MGLIIADEEFYRGALRIKDISSELREIISLYKIIMDELLKEGICDLLVNNVLAEKTDTLNAFINTAERATDNILEYTCSLITGLDEADSYLYD